MPFTPKFVDLVRNATGVTGTGPVTLGAAVSGYVSLADAVTVGDQFYYCIQGIDKPTEREVGRGTMLAGGTIARQPAGGAATNFTPGAKTIALVAAADWFATLGQMVNGGSDSLSALTTTNKSNLVAAVNEVSAVAAAAAGGGPSLWFAAAAGASIGASVQSIETSGHGAAGEGAARYVFDASVNAAVVAANPATCFIAADGRGFRLDPKQRLTIEMFGGGTAKTAAQNYSAIMAAVGFEPDPTRNFSPTIHFGIGKYLVSQTVEVHTACHLRGMTSGHNGLSATGTFATILEWPTDILCLRNQSSNTSGNTSGPTLGQQAAPGSIIQGIAFRQTTQGASLTAHGVQMRAGMTLRECAFDQIAGDAVHINVTAGTGGATEGDGNNWRVDHCFVWSCNGDGLHVEGQDANAGVSTHFITHEGVLGCGIFDRSGLGNTYIAPQITGYGNKGVFHLGRRYQLIESGAAGGATTPGTNNNIWYDLGPLAAANSVSPQWVGGTAYRPQLPLFIIGASTVVGGYQEFLSGLLAHTPGAVMIGANFATTSRSNLLDTPSFVSGIAATNGLGHFRSTGGSTTHPEYAKSGLYSWTMLGTVDLADSAATGYERRSILNHYVEQDGADAMQWHWVGKDQQLNYFNQKPIWSFGGPGTLRNYGRSTPQPYVLTLHDFALQDPGDSNSRRIMGLRDAAPTTGNHARGEFFFNLNPGSSGTLGWSCTTAGTPGTWTAVPVAGFTGSYAGNVSFTANLTVGGADDCQINLTNSSGYNLRTVFNAGTSQAYISNVKDGVGYGPLYIRGSAINFLADTLVAAVVATGIDLEAGKVLKVGGSQVVGTRGAAVADAIDAASAITQLNVLLARCRAHGLIA